MLFRSTFGGDVGVCRTQGSSLLKDLAKDDLKGERGVCVYQGGC